MPLDPTTATNTVLEAMQATIAARLRRPAAAVASIAALRARASLGPGGTTTLDESTVELVPVTGGHVWIWSATSTATDDGATVVEPSDRVAGSIPGRWLVTAATSATGYLNAVRIYEGDEAEASFMDRLLGVAPAVGIVWKGETGDKESGGVPGAFYRVWMDIEILCVSRNLRRGNEAFLGSAVAGEDYDPGVLRVVGDVRKIVAGSDLGLTDAIDYCYPRDHKPRFQSQEEGQFVHALGVRIPLTLRYGDPDGEDWVIPDPAGVRLAQQIVATDDTLHTINPGDPDQVPAP